MNPNNSIDDCLNAIYADAWRSSRWLVWLKMAVWREKGSLQNPWSTSFLSRNQNASALLDFSIFFYCIFVHFLQFVFGENFSFCLFVFIFVFFKCGNFLGSPRISRPAAIFKERSAIGGKKNSPTSYLNLETGNRTSVSSAEELQRQQ